MDYDLRYLQTPLPEDIAKLKHNGQQTQALRVIDLRLKKELPSALRARLMLEKEILKRISQVYSYGFDEALELMSRSFNDVTPADLETLWEQDAVDWYYIDGQLRFTDTLVDNIIKTRPDYAGRVKDTSALNERQANFDLLDAVMGEMKKNAGIAYRMHMRSVLTVAAEAERAGALVKVHLPIPVEYAQVKDFRLISATPEPRHISRADYPQRTVYFEERLQPGQEFAVEYEFTNQTRYVEPKPEEVAKTQPTFYTDELPPHIAFSPYIRALAAELTDGEPNPLLRARRIYDFITNRVMYSFVRPYMAIENIPEYCLTGLKGDCGIQALAFITLCRAAGIPARWQSGLYATPKYVGNHDWAQFYIAPYGWLFADCSFGGAAWREKSYERWNFYFGNLDPYRIPTTSEFQHELYPAKAFLRDDPYDNQSGEAEYADGGIIMNGFSTKNEMLKIEETAYRGNE